MNINEIVSLNSSIVIKDSDTGVVTVVAYINASLDSGNMNSSVSVNTVNKPLALANSIEVKRQYDEFTQALQTKGQALGYPIFGGAI